MLTAVPVYDLEKDLFRVQQIRPEGVQLHPIPDDSPFDAFHDEKRGKARAWIDEALAISSCLVVFIGAETASRAWVGYAIGKARELDKPMIGVVIDALADENGQQSESGASPFANSGLSARALAQIEIYTPPFLTSVFARSHIRYGLSDWIDIAVRENERSSVARSRRQAS